MLRASHPSQPLFWHLRSAWTIAAARPYRTPLHSLVGPPPQPLSHNLLVGVLSQVCKRHGNICSPKLNCIQVICGKLVIKYYGVEDNFHYLLIQFLLMFLGFYSSGYRLQMDQPLYRYPKPLKTCWLARLLSFVCLNCMRYIYPSPPSSASSEGAPPRPLGWVLVWAGRWLTASTCQSSDAPYLLDQLTWTVSAHALASPLRHCHGIYGILAQSDPPHWLRGTQSTVLLGRLLDSNLKGDRRENHHHSICHLLLKTIFPN